MKYPAWVSKQLIVILEYPNVTEGYRSLLLGSLVIQRLQIL